VIAKCIEVNGVLTSLDIRWNGLGEAGKVLLRDAVNSKPGFALQM
jgi:hypothetical protein